MSQHVSCIVIVLVSPRLTTTRCSTIKVLVILILILIKMKLLTKPQPTFGYILALEAQKVLPFIQGGGQAHIFSVYIMYIM